MNTSASRSAIALRVLTALFAARVVGQALVAYVDVTGLPAMEAWSSGLLPYPVLLPSQLVILLVQVVIDRGLRRGKGFFARPHSGRILQWFSCVYALSMVMRYAVLRSHLIPIVFHWVLAAYLFTLGRLMGGRPQTDGPVGDRGRVGTRTLRPCSAAIDSVRVLESSQVLRDLRRVGSFDSKRAERPKVLFKDSSLTRRAPSARYSSTSFRV
jgi:hypothetical protein